MSSDTIIHLPMHCSARQVLHVIGKLTGLDAPQKTGVPDGMAHPSQDVLSRVDTACESSASNPWYLDWEPLKSALYMTGDNGNGSDYFSLHYSTPTGFRHMLLFPHCEWEVSKLMNPNSTAFAIAIGRRLLDFFGGQMWNDDGGNRRPADYSIDLLATTFPPRKYHQSPEDRWYQFQNLVHQMVCLSPGEMLDANESASYFQGDDVSAMANFLGAIHDQKQLQKNTVSNRVKSAGSFRL